jgi:hypothetical protein
MPQIDLSNIFACVLMISVVVLAARTTVVMSPVPNSLKHRLKSTRTGDDKA